MSARRPEPSALSDHADDAPVARAVLRTAIAWQLTFDGAPEQAAAHGEFQDWLAASPEHARAWRQLARLDDQFARHATPADRAVLARPQARRPGVASLLAVALLSAGSLFAVHRVHPLPQLSADLRTATGEVRHQTLADGSEISLNTQTAVDLDFGPEQRRIVLRAGEIHLQTTVASRADPRPLLVVTPQGSVQALGTRFLVRRDGAASAVSVLAERVIVRPAHCPPPPATGACPEAQTLVAGQHLAFNADGLGRIDPAQAEADAWRDHLLVVDNRRLAEVVAEIGRHSPGLIRVAPAVANLRLTGTLPLAAPEQALAALTRSLPVRLVKRANGLWTDIEPGHGDD